MCITFSGEVTANRLEMKKLTAYPKNSPRIYMSCLWNYGYCGEGRYVVILGFVNAIMLIKLQNPTNYLTFVINSLQGAI